MPQMIDTFILNDKDKFLLNLMKRAIYPSQAQFVPISIPLYGPASRSSLAILIVECATANCVSKVKKARVEDQRRSLRLLHLTTARTTPSTSRVLSYNGTSLSRRPRGRTATGARTQTITLTPIDDARTVVDAIKDVVGAHEAHGDISR